MSSVMHSLLAAPRSQPAGIGPSSSALQSRLHGFHEAPCLWATGASPQRQRQQKLWTRQAASGSCRSLVTSASRDDSLNGVSSSEEEKSQLQHPVELQPHSWRPAAQLRQWCQGEHRLLSLGAGAAVLAAIGSGDFDLAGPASTVGALALLGGIVAIHEAGHFAAARLQNIHVTKFSIGFGPALLKWQGKQGVEYALRAIPLGGFVGFPDDDPELSDKYPPDDPNLLRNRPIKDRALVISAGIIANCILAYSILLTQVSTVGVIQTSFLPGVRIPEVVQSSVAQRAGLQSGDRIVAVDGQDVVGSVATVNNVVSAIKAKPLQRMSFRVERGEQMLEVPVTVAEAPDGTGRIGVQLQANAKISRAKPGDPLASLVLAGKEFGKLTNTVVSGLLSIVLNFSKTKDAVSGPVAIVAVGAEVARNDLSGLYQFAAIVNINLAVVNALPLPALDGGFMALLAAEAVRGKKLDETLEKTIMASGILLLMAVGGVLVVRDTLNLGGFISHM